MKKVVLIKMVPQNQSLQEAQQDFLHDEGDLDLDFELEELESRLALDYGQDGDTGS